ncbi:MAG: PQQ-binding-like beta-propeller repeat protein [Actinomycetota bacterium]
MARRILWTALAPLLMTTIPSAPSTAAAADEAWSRTFGGWYDLWPTRVAAGPGGSRVYASIPDRRLLAFDADTGTTLWERKSGGDRIYVSPGGGRLFLMHNYPFEVEAVDTVTGETLWTSRLQNPFDHWVKDDFAYRAVLDPSGRRIFVIGDWTSGKVTWGNCNDDCTYVPVFDWMTAAFRTRDGSVLWQRRYGCPKKCDDTVSHLALAGEGRTLVVGGDSDRYDGRLVGYDAASGKLRWERALSWSPEWMSGNPKQPTVYATGRGFRTVAMRQDGQVLWTGQHPSGVADAYATQVLSSPDGKHVWVGGTANGDEFDPEADLSVVSFAASDGALEWEATHDEGDGEDLWSLAADPSSSRLYAAGLSRTPGGPGWAGSEALAVAFDAADGTEAWSRTYDSGVTGESSDQFTSAAVAPDGSRVYVAGRFEGCCFLYGWPQARVVALDADENEHQDHREPNGDRGSAHRPLPPGSPCRAADSDVSRDISTITRQRIGVNLAVEAPCHMA